MDGSPLWQDGWYPPARRVASPNHGLRPATVVIDLIVIHSISLPPGCFGGNEVEALFTNRLDTTAHPYFAQLQGLEVSSHFFIRRDGEIVQFVSTEQRAWHAGRSAYRGRENCNDDSVGIELEGLEGGLFEPQQYQQLARLCRDLAAELPIQHLAGHEHVAPGRKQDPGPGFDWGLLQVLSGLPARYFPEGCRTATQVPPA
jgi:N-acetyl-anhydromuramoyl-L-alanine amidase